jgi:hypothetical protein
MVFMNMMSVIGLIVLLMIVLIVALVGIAIVFVLSRRKHAARLQEHFGAEYDQTVLDMGDEKKARVELKQRQAHVQSMNIQPLSENAHHRFHEMWAAVQTRFVDEPGKALLDADGLIMEVMQTRGYPVAGFDQRAADISVNYPELMSNYRTARASVIKNQQGIPDTEELRQAMIYYRSLFEKLLKTEPVAA